MNQFRTVRQIIQNLPLNQCYFITTHIFRRMPNSSWLSKDLAIYEKNGHKVGREISRTKFRVRNWRKRLAILSMKQNGLLV